MTCTELDHYIPLEENIVDVPSTQCPLTLMQLNQLSHAVDPTGQSNVYGTDIFLHTIQFVHDVLGL